MLRTELSTPPRPVLSTLPEERLGIYKLHVEAQTALMAAVASAASNTEAIAALAAADATDMGSADPPPINNPSGPKDKIGKLC